MNIPVPQLYLGKRYHAELFAVLGVLGFLVNMLILFAGGVYLDKESYKLVSSLTVSAWVLLPPLWFFYEFFYYFPKHGNPAAGFDRLKAVQDVTSKVWAAVGLVLGAIYTVKFSA
ncbi:hypothetical protein MJ904_08100 [Massilia sp. MB5]|uniref:hypothetical protein n=1 Tax=unclassified Massilia TaxID=2609279 RepID=UPI00067B535D|nr:MULTISPECIES: hypothetical protein [unclassified Massilia]AKU23012.1 hypothetical protein ACZ75_17665 [Massilia sp. NR 4-1]UMR32122.1 hypothetical protein MJ904_08100 [Massilia sp. MB5]